MQRTPIQNHSSLHRAALVAVALLVAFIPVSRAATTTAENTQAVVDAANAFLALLTTSQKTAINSTSNVTNGGSNSSCQYNFLLANAEVWSNIPVAASTRNGLQFSALSSTQLTAALAVADAALSDTGTTLLEQIRLADKYISGEVTNSLGSTSNMWGYSKYYIAFVGTPSTTSPWTLQIGGHHMAYNITYNGTYTAGTPMFAGNEPNSFTISGVTYAPLGTQRTLITTLRTTLTTSALLSGSYSDVVFGPNGTGSHDTVQPKSYPTSGRGQLYSSLTTSQQAVVRQYITSWVSTMNASISDSLLADYLSDAALAETYVGYAGSSTTLATQGSYFRVDGPRVWIEFIVQGGVYDHSGVHDHGVWRDKLADYGAAYGSTTIATTLTRPSITTQPASQSVAVGGAATLSVVAGGSSTLTYQWYKDSSAISGATASSYPVSVATSSDAGSYYVVVTNSAGVETSSVATLTVSASAPTITTQPVSASVVVGDSATLSVEATGSGTLTYQWYLGDGAISGATGSAYALASVTAADAGNYTVVVTGDGGSTTSDTATLTVTLTVTEPYTTYLSGYGLTAGGADTDTDSDGVPDLLEFVLGGDPTTPDASILPAISMTTVDDASALVLSFSAITSLGSVTWSVESSTDLSTWTAVEDGVDGATIDTVAGDGVEFVTVTLPTSDARLFARVRVVAP